MKLSKITTGFTKLSDGRLEDQALAVAAAMNGNTNYPDPSPALADLNNSIKLFSDALALAGTRDKVKIAIKNKLRVDLNSCWSDWPTTVPMLPTVTAPSKPVQVFHWRQKTRSLKRLVPRRTLPCNSVVIPVKYFCSSTACETQSPTCSCMELRPLPMKHGFTRLIRNLFSPSKGWYPVPPIALKSVLPVQKARSPIRRPFLK